MINVNNVDKIINIITEEINKSDVIDIIKNDKEFEKRVKKIASDVVTELFRVLWQHNSIFKSLGN
jgi:hypothetical protein